MHPLMKLQTPYNMEPIDKIGKNFWQKDLMTVEAVNKKPLKGAAISHLFVALWNSNTAL